MPHAPTRHTLHPHDIRLGDTVVGFPAPVMHTAIDGFCLTITFADGQVWHVSDTFETTVLRPAPGPA